MMNRLTPIVQHLIILNIIIYIGLAFLPDEIAYDYFMVHKTNAIGLYPEVQDRAGTIGYMDRETGKLKAIGGKFLPLQIVTNFFYHSRGNLFHIILNMFVLASLGPLCEMVLGSQRFLKFYLFCGVVAGILLAFFDPSPVPVVGASTAISGVLVAFALLFPRQKLQFLFIPFGFEARHFVGGIAVISAVLVVMQFLGLTNGGFISHFGHLAGMIAAVVFFYLEKQVPFLKS